MIKRFPVSLLLAISTSSALAGCQVDVEDPTNAQPVIHLNGESTMALDLNQAYIEPGYQALDAEDGDLTANVLSNSAIVNTQVAGRYEITYSVTDSSNSSAKPAKRVVMVGAAQSDIDAGQSIEGSDTSTNGVPKLAAFNLVAFTPEREKVEVSEITNGSTLDLSLMPTNLLNIEAVSMDEANTGSVHFVLDGPITIDRYENTAIYTMQVEPLHLNTENNELPVGDYSLTVTPYSAPDMGGNKGLTQTVTFSVQDRQIEVSSVPNLLAADFVVLEEATGAMPSLSRITEGFELDLSTIPAALINVVAISEDASRTGSVHFSLNGPTTIDRYENDATYTMAVEPTALDITKDGLKAGDYTLIITPYAEKDMGGEAGIPYLVNFSVTGQAIIDGTTAPVTGGAPAPGTVVTDPVETGTLAANADSYAFYAGSDQQPGMTTAVSANDVFDDASARFTIVSLPKHGTVTMFDLGYFEYVPASGYVGSDSFTYQVSQNGEVATANTTISVYDPQSKQGFTAIEPSADSKLIYVSSSQGSDTNTCLAPSMPCKSIGAAFEKMRNGYPDHVYLKRGDRWKEQNLNGVSSGRSAKERAVIASYGEGPRPLIEHSTIMGSFNKGELANIAFIGLNMSAYKLDPTNPEFTGAKADHANMRLLGAHKNILFEDNIFNYIEVIVQDWEGRPSDFSFRRNIFTGAYVNTSSYNRDSRPSNIFVKGIDGLVLEENVFDYGGWNPKVKGAGANMFNHNIYLQHGSDGNRITVRNNIITRGSSHGIQMRAGGIADDNFFGRNAVSLLISYDLDGPTGGLACGINNVITEGDSMVRGVDPCIGDNLCTPAVWGIDFNTQGTPNWQAYNNIVHSLAAGDDEWQTLTTWSKLVLHSVRLKDPAVVKIADNHTWRWATASEGNDQGYSDPGRTLGSYYAHLKQQGVIKQDAAGADNFDKFMTLVKTRAPGSWPEALTASAINDYVRAGYGIQATGQCK